MTLEVQICIAVNAQANIVSKLKITSARDYKENH